MSVKKVLEKLLKTYRSIGIGVKVSIWYIYY